jgi:tetratricopeptide (TPR) repeat protein
MLLNNLAWIYAAGGEMKNGELALRYAREALLTSPVNPNVWNTLAEAYYILGQYEPALRASELALDLFRMQQGVTEEQAQGFVQQYQKIQRARDSAKMLLNLNQDE